MRKFTNDVKRERERLRENKSASDPNGNLKCFFFCMLFASINLDIFVGKINHTLIWRAQFNASTKGKKNYPKTRSFHFSFDR